MGRNETDKLERKERNKIRRWTSGAERERDERRKGSTDECAGKRRKMKTG